MRLLLCSFFTIFCSACVPTSKMQTQFSHSDFNLYQKQGTGSLAGQAFLKTKGGDVKYAAGNDIFLIESNRYTDELFSASMSGKRVDTSSINPSLRGYAKKAIGDGEGRFHFDNLAPGRYYVFTTIKWNVNKYRTTGGDVIKGVNIPDGKTIDVVLTR